MQTVTLRDKDTGETLPGGVVTIENGFETRGVTDENGDATLSPGKYTARMIGYSPKNFEVKTTPVEVSLNPQPITGPEVIIEAKRSTFNPFWLILFLLVVWYFSKRA